MTKRGWRFSIEISAGSICRLLLICLAVLAPAGLSVTSASAQQTATWSGAAGDWAPCPPDGSALWNTCKQDPPVFPNGNFDADIQGGPVTLGAFDDWSIINLTIEPSYILTFDQGSLHINGDTIHNDGSITMADGSILYIDGAQVMLMGVGSVALQTPDVSIRGSGGELVNLQTIQGQGAIGEGQIVITNEATINAFGGTLTIQPNSAGASNIGTMEALPGSTLVLGAGVPLKYDNTGGIIKASDGATVSLGGATFAGGTLMTLGSGIFTTPPGGSNPTLDRVTNMGNFMIPTGAQVTLKETINNSGTFQLQGQMNINGGVTLQGTGTVPMSSGLLQSTNGTDALLNQQLIHGSGTIRNITLTNQGTIDADNSSTQLSLVGSASVPTANNATLEASNGGNLLLQTVINNNGGTIAALNGSTVTLAATVSGGVLITQGNGTIQSQNATLDGTVNIPTNQGQLDVSVFDLFMQGTISNTGTIALSGNGCIILNQPTTLVGSGTVTMGSGNCIIGSGNAFDNKSTIMGAGTIGDSNPMPITNNGSIAANQTSPLAIVPDTSGFTNNGKLIVNSGSTLNIDGLFNNLSNAGALTGGTYSLMGTLGLQNSNITSSAANITLIGAGQILNNLTQTSALTTLATNAKRGMLSLQKGQALTTKTNLVNAGTITIDSTSGLTVGGYVQAGGTTTVDGTLTAPKGVNLKSGILLGGGTLAGSVTAAGILGVGDSLTKPTKLTVTGSYTQNGSGAVYVGIGGTQAGTEYSQLTVSNGVNLNGTLAIKLINGFVPAVGDTFTIVTGSAVTGQFSQVDGLQINSSEKFQVNYTPTSVTLTVVSGA